jgi:ATP-binding cassette subfamily B protein
VLVDGRDVASWDLAELRRYIGFVPQRLHLFPGTIESNLCLGGRSPAAAREAVARLRLEHLIERIPGGWDAPVTEHGANLSAGERQLLCAARAWVADPPLLILDEATSAIDPASERWLQHALTELMRGRTSLVIAHRLATVANADRILVLDGGMVVEQGRHEELLAAGGHYARLAALQQQSVLEGILAH